MAEGPRGETRRQARHQARILAIQALYEFDAAHHPVDAVLERLFAEGTAIAAAKLPPVAAARSVTTEELAAILGEHTSVPGGDEDDEALEHLVGGHVYPDAVVTFAWRLVRGVVRYLDEIDPLIAVAAPTWPLAQMAKIDKSILRLAVYEVLHEPDIPYKAAINEAVEIAKLYGSDSSGRFVNGVLGTIVSHRADRRTTAHRTNMVIDAPPTGDER